MTTAKATRIREAPFNLELLAHVVEQECDRAPVSRKRKASVPQRGAPGHSSDDNYFDESLAEEGYNRDELDTLECLQHMAEAVEAEEDERRRCLKRSPSDHDTDTDRPTGYRASSSRARTASYSRRAHAPFNEVPSHITETTLYSMSKQQRTPESDRAADSPAIYSQRVTGSRAPRRARCLAPAAADSDPHHSNPSVSTKSQRNDNVASPEVTSDTSAKSAPGSAVQQQPAQQHSLPAAAQPAAAGVLQFQMPGAAAGTSPFMPPFMPFPAMMPMMMGAMGMGNPMMYNPFLPGMATGVPGSSPTSNGTGPAAVQGLPAPSQPVPGLPATPEPSAAPTPTPSDGSAPAPPAAPFNPFAQQHMKAMMASFAQAMARMPFFSPLPGQPQQQPAFPLPFLPFFPQQAMHKDRSPALSMEAYLTPENIAKVLPTLDVARIKPWVLHNFCEEAFLLLLDAWRSDSPKVKEAVWAHYNHVERPDAPDYRAFMVSVFGLDKLVQITQASRVAAAARAAQQQQQEAAAARQRQQQQVVLVAASQHPHAVPAMLHQLQQQRMPAPPAMAVSAPQQHLAQPVVAAIMSAPAVTAALPAMPAA